MKEMRFEAVEEARFALQPDDLVVCEGGEPGRAAVWKGQAEGARDTEGSPSDSLFDLTSNDATFALYSSSSAHLRTALQSIIQAQPSST